MICKRYLCDYIDVLVLRGRVYDIFFVFIDLSICTFPNSNVFKANQLKYGHVDNF